MGEIIVQQLGMDNWQDYRAIRLAALKNHPGVYCSNYAKEEAKPESFWRERLSLQNRAVFGLFDHERCIGLGGIYITNETNNEKTARLAMGYIAPDYRRQKLSHLLYQIRIQWAQNHGCSKILVSHRKDNIASKRANQAFGFQFTHEEDTTWPDGQVMAECFYELDLE